MTLSTLFIIASLFLLVLDSYTGFLTGRQDDT